MYRIKFPMRLPKSEDLDDRLPQLPDKNCKPKGLPKPEEKADNADTPSVKPEVKVIPALPPTAKKPDLKVLIPPPPPPKPMSLELINLSKSFSRGKGKQPFLAVDGVNASVIDQKGKGEFISIIGPSGCGKSTLLQMIAGFDTHMPPTSGTVKFQGQEVLATDPSRGMLFQDYGCYPHLNVLNNVAFGLRLHREQIGLREYEINDMAQDWLNRVKLTHKDYEKYPHELSGGMRQRVALARCLALKPKCLLMDEPFSALDEPTRYEMQDLIVALWAEIEATVLLVSHSISEAVFLGERVWIVSSAPGTIAAEFTSVPPPDPSKPAMTQRTDRHFMESVREISECFQRLLHTPRQDIMSVFADGTKDRLPVY